MLFIIQFETLTTFFNVQGTFKANMNGGEGRMSVDEFSLVTIKGCPPIPQNEPLIKTPTWSTEVLFSTDSDSFVHSKFIRSLEI